MVPFTFSVFGNPAFKSTSFRKPPGKDAGRKLRCEWGKYDRKALQLLLERKLGSQRSRAPLPSSAGHGHGVDEVTDTSASAAGERAVVWTKTGNVRVLGRCQEILRARPVQSITMGMSSGTPKVYGESTPFCGLKQLEAGSRGVAWRKHQRSAWDQRGRRLPRKFHVLHIAGYQTPAVIRVQAALRRHHVRVTSQRLELSLAPIVRVSYVWTRRNASTFSAGTPKGTG